VVDGKSGIRSLFGQFSFLRHLQGWEENNHNVEEKDFSFSFLFFLLLTRQNTEDTRNFYS
jgi:hypothetical protein